MNFHEFKNTFQKKEVRVIEKSTISDPRVSVLVQTYQHEKYIRDCLEGILHQQTNFAFEILIGEDDSKDKTKEICIEYAEKFPNKIRLFLHRRENQIKVLQEPTSNFNALYNFFSAKGKYIAFCEGDDAWCDSYKLQKQVDFLENNPRFVFTYHSFHSIDSEGTELIGTENNLQPRMDLDLNELLRVKYHPLLLCTCFRNVIKEIPVEMTQVINVDTFLFSLLGQWGEAKYLNTIKPANYRRHSGGIWSKRINQKKFLSKIITYQNLTEYYRKENNPDLVQYFKKKQMDSCKMLIYSMIKAGDIFPAYKETKRFLELVLGK